MPLPFDATLKQLVRDHPLDWLAALGAPVTQPVEVLTPDLSTVTRFADTVLRLGDAGIIHLDFQTGPDPGLSRRMLLYNVLLHEAYALAVHTVVVLLRPRAATGGLRGSVKYHLVPRRGKLDFRFEVFRVWRRPAEEFLTGGLGIVPLAVLGQLPRGENPPVGLARVVSRLVQRIVSDASPHETAGLITSAFVLSGLRIPKNRGVELFHGVRAMRESTTYQYILDEGRAEGRAEGQLREARKMLLRLGRRKFNQADTAAEAVLQAIDDLDRLERMSERLLDVTTWQDLLATQ